MTDYLTVHDQHIAVDKEGFLKNLQDWDQLVAAELALREDIRLGPSHWEILNLLRMFSACSWDLSGCGVISSASTIGYLGPFIAGACVSPGVNPGNEPR